MVISIAKEFGRAVEEIVRQPIVVTLWTWMEFQESKRIELLIDDHNRLRLAGLVACAVNSPKGLEEQEWEWKKRAGIISEPDEARATAEQLAKDYEEAQRKEAERNNPQMP